jgi:hypothetical protein
MMRIGKALVAATAAVLLGMAPVWAHGAPSVSASTDTISPGGTVTLSGDGLGATGDVITLELKGPSYDKQLGQATLGAPTDDAFADQTFAVPADVPAGSYKIVAEKTENGTETEVASTEITVAAGATSSAASQTGQGVPAPDRSTTEWVVAALLVVIPTAAGLFALFVKEVRPGPGV